MSASASNFVAEQFSELLGSDDGDVEVLIGCEGKPFRVHSLVMKVRSPFFKAMLSSGMQESLQQAIRLPSLSAQSFQMFLPFVYGGCLKEKVTDVGLMIEMLDLADFLQMRDFHRYAIHHWDLTNAMREEWSSVTDDDVTGVPSFARKWLQWGNAFQSEVDTVLAETAGNLYSEGMHLCVANFFGLTETKGKLITSFGDIEKWENTDRNVEDEFQAVFPADDWRACLATELRPTVSSSIDEIVTTVMLRAADKLSERTSSSKRDVIGRLLRSASALLKYRAPEDAEEPQAKQQRCS